MKKNLTLVVGALSLGLIFGCGSEESLEQTTEETTSEAEEVIVEETNDFLGTYTLTGMTPVTGDKELTAQDEEYIKNAKERTLGKTTLTFSDGGTFERVFPHPSGDGTTKTWTGDYELNEDAGTLVLNALINEKVMPIEFTIEEKTASVLSLKSSFGQIFMTYTYTK